MELEDGKDNQGRDWPYERCKSETCSGRRVVFGFSVPDDIWEKVSPDGINVLCLTCFDELAQDMGVRYKKDLEVFTPVTWEDIG